MMIIVSFVADGLRSVLSFCEEKNESSDRINDSCCDHRMTATSTFSWLTFSCGRLEWEAKDMEAEEEEDLERRLSNSCHVPLHTSVHHITGKNHFYHQSNLQMYTMQSLLLPTLISIAPVHLHNAFAFYSNNRPLS